VFAQPLNELDYVGITPHPSRKPAKVGQRFHSKCVVACVVHIAIDTVGVWPIRLHRYSGETFFLDEPFRDLGAVVVKVVRTVGRLSEQHDARLADELEERIVVPG
jgi:hypothetical protein